MEGFPEKRYKTSLIYSLPALFLLLILALVFGRGAFTMYKVANGAKDTEKTANSRLEDLMKREGFLQGSIDKLSTQEGVEQALREKFNVRRAGEEMVILVSPETKTLPGDSSFGIIRNWFSQIF